MRHRNVALLRGINVGGRNKVPMAELREAFTDAGFTGVATYIQSGNVVFDSDCDPDPLEVTIEDVLERRLGLSLVVVVRSKAQLREVVAGAPDGFGRSPDRFHSDVVFLKAPLQAADVLDLVSLREGVDHAWAGEGVVYFARLSAQRARSRLGRLASLPEYQLMTIRNWATTTKLLAMVDEA